MIPLHHMLGPAAGHTAAMPDKTAAEEQQELILEDSELRVVNGRTPPGNDDVERRTSDEATPPVDVDG